MAEMPQVEPYDFVPLVGKPVRGSPVGHDRYAEGRHGGLLECKLTARSPVFVYHPGFAQAGAGGHETARFPVFGGVAVIPGSSLKGVVRSLVEAIEPCCFALPSSFPRTYRGSGITRGSDIEVRLPPGFEHCHEKVEIARDVCRPKALCPACRLFGSLDPGKWAYAGNVSISDARSDPGEYALMDHLTLEVLSTPKPEGRPNAYLLADRITVRGRKFYRHRYPQGKPDVLERPRDQSGRPRRDHQNKTVQPVKEGSVFCFTVEYSDLDGDELRLLLYALVLEEGLWHKVGLGKPIGLGSVQIEIVKWGRIDRLARYRTLGGGLEAPLEGEALTPVLNEWLRAYRERQTEPLNKLREILRPDPAVDVRYRVQRPPPGSQGPRRWR